MEFNILYVLLLYIILVIIVEFYIKINKNKSNKLRILEGLILIPIIPP